MILRTLDLRFLQLSHATDVILLREGRRAYVLDMGEQCLPLVLANALHGPILGAVGATKIVVVSDVFARSNRQPG
jgi:hypothetical protein